MKMKKIAVATSAAIMGLSTLGMSTSASAEDMGLSFSANVAMVSDYVFRGVSLSDNEPAIQGGFDAEHTSGIYVGTWGSSADVADGIEIDVYAGWAGDLGPIGVDVGVIEYMFPGESGADVTEFYIGGSAELGPVGVGLTYYDADDFDGQQTWELTGEGPFEMVTLSAVWGTNDFDTAGADYDWWGVGASTELGGFGFAVNYTDTDVDNASDIADDNWWFTISKSL